MTLDQLKSGIKQGIEEQKIDSLVLENQSKVNHDEAMIALGKSQALLEISRALEHLEEKVPARPEGVGPKGKN